MEREKVGVRKKEKKRERERERERKWECELDRKDKESSEQETTLEKAGCSCRYWHFLGGLQISSVVFIHIQTFKRDVVKANLGVHQAGPPRC